MHFNGMTELKEEPIRWYIPPKRGGTHFWTDLSPLRNNGWQIDPVKRKKWIDPVTKRFFRTEDALKIQEGRTGK